MPIPSALHQNLKSQLTLNLLGWCCPTKAIRLTGMGQVHSNFGEQRKSAELVTGGKWKLAEEGGKFQPLPKGEPEVLHQVWVYQVT